MAARDLRSFGTYLIGGLRLLAYVMLFLSIVGIVLSPEIVRLLFDYGAFDQASLDLMAQTLGIFLVGLAGNAFCLLLARAFFSAQDTTTPLLGVLLCVAINVVISLATVGTYGVLGLAAGVAVGDWAEAIFLTLVMWRRIPETDLSSLLRALPVILLGALGAGLGALLTLRVSESIVGTDPATLIVLGQAIAATLVGAAVYLGYTRLVRLPELPRAIELLRSAIRRPGPIE